MLLRYLRVLGAPALLASFFCLGCPVPLGAHPNEELTADRPLYQKARELATEGLLEPEDGKILTEGEPVTRLQLAFYLERAKVRYEKFNVPEGTPTPQAFPSPSAAPPPPISQPMTPPPTAPAPAAPAPAVPLPSTSEGIPPPPEEGAAESPAATPMEPLEAPDVLEPSPAAPPQAPSPVAAVPVKPDAKQRIDELLKELQAESSYLRTRLALDNGRLKERRGELERLQNLQDEVGSAWRKSNQMKGVPNFYSSARWTFEHYDLSGLSTQNVYKANQEVNIGAWSDVGGVGSLSVGFGARLPASSTDTGPATLFAPSLMLTLDLEGPLGSWAANFAVESYNADTDLGTFARGAAPGKRFEEPFDVQNYSDDKLGARWENFMNSIGFVGTTALVNGSLQSSASYKVFDGLFMKGTKLPLLGDDATMTLLFGKMGDGFDLDDFETHLFEEGAKIEKPWLGGKVKTAVSTLWVNTIYDQRPPGMTFLDLRSYAANLDLNLTPFLIGFEAGLSSFQTEWDTPNPSPDRLEAGAGEASLQFYPFSVFASAISDGYTNFQGKVVPGGMDMREYGYIFADNSPGAVSEVNNLVSNRWGWRVNLGWNGRQADWLKGLPAFLDDLIVNCDYAQKTEYSAQRGWMTQNGVDADPYYTLETRKVLRFYQDESQGLWGNFWGGFGTVNPVRQAYLNNVQALRNDGVTSDGAAHYIFNGSTEVIPLIIPQMSGGMPVTNGLGQYVYDTLDNLKTYHYIALTLKPKFSKWFGLTTPLYGGFYFENNRVSGASSNTYEAIPNLFEQTVMDGVLMWSPAKDLHVLGNLGWEGWKSDFTWPRIDYDTWTYGLGFGWDIPWGGGKMEWRYKHLDFTSAYVPANNYQGDQIYGAFRFLF